MVKLACSQHKSKINLTQIIEYPLQQEERSQETKELSEDWQSHKKKDINSVQEYIVKGINGCVLLPVTSCFILTKGTSRSFFQIWQVGFLWILWN